MIIVLLLWIVLSILVGIFGSTKSIGFFIALILSLILSPLIGFIICALSGEESKQLPPFIKLIDSGDIEMEKENYIRARENYIEAKFYLNKYADIGNKIQQNYRTERLKYIENQLAQITRKSNE